MAKKDDYLGLPRLVSIILAILPTAWILGIITRLSEGKILAGVLRIFIGWFYIPDLVCMIISGRILRLL